jgi:hypothetical protein
VVVDGAMVVVVVVLVVGAVVVELVGGASVVGTAVVLVGATDVEVLVVTSVVAFTAEISDEVVGALASAPLQAASITTPATRACFDVLFRPAMRRRS